MTKPMKGGMLDSEQCRLKSQEAWHANQLQILLTPTALNKSMSILAKTICSREKIIFVGEEQIFPEMYCVSIKEV